MKVEEVTTNEFEKKQIEKWNKNKGTNLFEIKLDLISAKKTKIVTLPVYLGNLKYILLAKL